MASTILKIDVAKWQQENSNFNVGLNSFQIVYDTSIPDSASLSTRCCAAAASAALLLAVVVNVVLVDF